MSKLTHLARLLGCLNIYRILRSVLSSPFSQSLRYIISLVHPWVDDFKNFSNSEREGEVKSDMLNLVVTGALGYVIVYRYPFSPSYGRNFLSPLIPHAGIF